MPKDTEGSELDALFPTPLIATIGKERVEVRTLAVAEWGQLRSALLPFFKAAEIRGGFLSGVVSEMPAISDGIALATGRSTEWLERLPPKAYRAIGEKFIEANIDFFALCLGLAGSVNLATVTVRGAGDGQTHAPI
jgi:hypothetical protein